MDDLDERVLTLDLGATRQLSLALFRHSDSAGLITLLDLLATSAVERWLAAERSGGRDAASVWEQCVAPVIEKLGWTGIDAVRFRAPVILKETVDRLAWIINLRTLANQRIPVNDRIRAVNEAVYWLTVIGGYSVFRQRWEDLHTLLSVRTFRSHERIQERLWSKRNFPRLYESDVNRRVTSTPEVLALFMGDRENAGVNLCQFHFLAGFLFWPDAWQWYPWDYECEARHLEPLIEEMISGALSSRVYETWSRPQFAAYVKSLFGSGTWQTGPIAEFLASTSAQS